MYGKTSERSEPGYIFAPGGNRPKVGEKVMLPTGRARQNSQCG